jgi:hypothetical protein
MHEEADHEDERRAELSLGILLGPTHVVPRDGPGRQAERLRLHPGIRHLQEHEDSYNGQAHFARTGPEGKLCRECDHLFSGRCRVFAKLQGSWGPVLPSDAQACRYFSPLRGTG